LYVLNPVSDTNENDNSLVLYININNNKIMLTGDMSAKLEPKLINAYSNLKVDILKVGHHGSITSTSESLLDALKPKYAIIQVGLKNHFNHPSPIVIDRLINRGIKILQTSINGSIKFVLRSNDVTIISPVT
jgi:competence protein ComEC